MVREADWPEKSTAATITREMLSDGLFERFPCDAIFWMHNRPGLAVGKFQIRSGAMMAGSAYFDIAVTGRGAHGARRDASIDPVVITSHIAIVSRNVRPVDTAPVGITRFTRAPPTT